MKSKGNRTQFELARSSSYRGSTVHVYCICTLRAVVSPGQMLCYEGREATASNLSIKHACPCDIFVKMSNGITSSYFSGNIRDLKQDGNENIDETMGLISKTTTLHLHHHHHFLAFLCHFCMKLPNFTFNG